MSHSALGCVALLGLSVLVVRCVNLNEEFKRHSSMVARWKYPCGVPQPRVVYLQDLVDASEWENKYQSLYDMNNVRPKWTILSRCESSGCCEEINKRCLPSATEELLLTFSNITERMTFFQIPATNHTRCSCLTTDHHGNGTIR